MFYSCTIKTKICVRVQETRFPITLWQYLCLINSKTTNTHKFYNKNISNLLAKLILFIIKQDTDTVIVKELLKIQNNTSFKQKTLPMRMEGNLFNKNLGAIDPVKS